MRCVTAFRRRLTALRRDASGIAIPVVMMMITVGFAFASVGTIAAVSSMRNAGRDNSDKSAFAVAEAGAQAALFRQNKVLTNDLYPCLIPQANNIVGYALGYGEQWCSPVTGTVGAGTYTYRVDPFTTGDVITNGQRLIHVVSEGTLNGETRRVEVDAAASTGTPAFGGAQVVGLNRLDLTGNPSVVASMKTNADLLLQGSASCLGNVTVGSGKRVIPSNIACGGSFSQATSTLGPVDMGDVRTNNSNIRLTNGQDTKTQSNQVTVGSVAGSSAKTLNLDSHGTLTLGGTNYLLCSLTLGAQSELIVAQQAKVRLYFDTPENCGLSSGATQISTGGGSRISVTSGNPDDLALLVAGSDTRVTNISMQGNSSAENQITIYAPKSLINIGGTADYRGAIAGKEVTLSGDGTIRGSDSSLNFTANVETAYKRTRFVECTGPVPLTGTASTGC